MKRYYFVGRIRYYDYDTERNIDYPIIYETTEYIKKKVVSKIKKEKTTEANRGNINIFLNEITYEHFLRLTTWV